MTTFSRSLAAAGFSVLLLGAGVAPALAHNHVFNPSGVCNASGMGGSPGNSGETTINPGGHEVGQAKADSAHGAEHCHP